MGRRWRRPSGRQRSRRTCRRGRRSRGGSKAWRFLSGRGGGPRDEPPDRTHTYVGVRLGRRSSGPCVGTSDALDPRVGSRITQNWTSSTGWRRLPTLARRPAGTPPATTARGRLSHRAHTPSPSDQTPGSCRRRCSAAPWWASNSGTAPPTRASRADTSGCRRLAGNVNRGGRWQPHTLARRRTSPRSRTAHPTAFSSRSARVVGRLPPLAGGVLNRLRADESAGSAGRPATGPCRR